MSWTSLDPDAKLPGQYYVADTFGGRSPIHLRADPTSSEQK